jgi:hypothetical protein
MTREEYEAYLASKRGETIPELRKRLREMHAVIGPCDCTDYADCKGWRLYDPDDFTEGDAA